MKIVVGTLLAAISLFAEMSYDAKGKLYADFLVTGRGEVAKSLGKYKINNENIAEKGFQSEPFAKAINVSFF
jgi:hypothetical protein